MNLATLASRNMRRNRFHTALTVAGVAVAILTFVMLRTVIIAWSVAADYAAKDRLGIRHKISFSLPLPKRYVDAVREVPGVSEVCYITWFGGKDPRNPNNVFATLAMGESCLSVFDEMEVEPAQRDAWLSDRRGAIIGDLLAQRLGAKVGDRVTLQSTIFPGDWQFNINGIYTTGTRPFDRAQFIIHWDYLNESLAESRRDQIGWMVARIDDPARGPDISAEIDRRFDEKGVPTKTMSIRAMSTSFLGLLSAVLSAIDIATFIILVIMTLILGNTIAMGVRERAREHAVLRALGFSPSHVALLIVGESIVIGALGGALGLAISYPLVELGVGRFLEQQMGHLFPYFRITTGTKVLALLLSAVLPIPASLAPALRASKLPISDALRRVA